MLYCLFFFFSYVFFLVSFCIQFVQQCYLQIDSNIFQKNSKERTKRRKKKIIIIVFCLLGKHINLNTCTCKSSNLYGFRYYFVSVFTTTHFFLFFFSPHTSHFCYFILQRIMRTYNSNKHLSHLRCLFCLTIFPLEFYLGYFFPLQFNISIFYFAYSRYTFFV